MATVEFVMQPESRDFSKALKDRMLASRAFYFYGMILLLIFVVTAAVGGIYSGSGYDVLFVLLLVACPLGVIIPFRAARLIGQGHFRSWNKYGERRFRLDKEGLGCKTDLYEWRMRWPMFRRIRETEQFIFLYEIEGPCRTIYKTCLPGDTLSAIRTLISTVPVVDKEMLRQAEGAFSCPGQSGA